MQSAARLMLIAALAFAWPAEAAPLPTLLGAFTDWTAYQTETADGKVCYVVSIPTAMAPKRVRDPIFFIVSTWPSRNITDELQVVPGYQYKDGETAVATVGTQHTQFFTQNDGKAGSALVQDQANEAALVAAMRGGATMTVVGTSKRGTRTTDTYSLKGFTTALDRAHTACK